MLIVYFVFLFIHSILTVTNSEQLFIISPATDETIIIPNFIPIFIKTLNPERDDQMTVTLACGDYSTDYIVFTNQPEDYEYDPIFYGKCTLKVIRAPYYYDYPEPVSFFLKYQLEFVSGPDIIIVGKPFIIYLEPTEENVQIDSVNVQIVCDGRIDQIFPNINFHPTSLILKNAPISNRYCFLTTISDNSTSMNYFVQVYYSPSGGIIIPINDEEQSDFAKLISFSVKKHIY